MWDSHAALVHEQPTKQTQRRLEHQEVIWGLGKWYHEMCVLYICVYAVLVYQCKDFFYCFIWSCVRIYICVSECMGKACKMLCELNVSHSLSTVVNNTEFYCKEVKSNIQNAISFIWHMHHITGRKGLINLGKKVVCLLYSDGTM